MAHRLVKRMVPVSILALLLSACASTAADDLGLDAEDVEALELAGVNVNRSRNSSQRSALILSSTWRLLKWRRQKAPSQPSPTRTHTSAG